MVLNSYAKLNLYLKVLNKRKDSYHNIRTLFERIDLCDKIILSPRPDKKINLKTNSPDLPKDTAKNLAYQSARLLQKKLNLDRGVDIRIIKRIPVGSGLGGGSSNAAAVLLGLNKLWRLNLKQNELADFAKIIGCDAPFFIYNCSFAQGEARGDRIKPIKLTGNRRLWHILVIPKRRVSTPLIYKLWDREKGKLTMPKYDAKILNLALKKNDFALLGENLFNDLEQITRRLYPEVRRIRERLKGLGLKSILMSGSGPAVFAIISSRKEALSLCRQLKAESRFWQTFVTRTI